MIDFTTNPSSQYVPDIDVPRTSPYPMPTGAEEIPNETDGHITTSIRQGLGNGYLLPAPPNGMNLPDDIRRAMNYLSRFDIEYGSNFAITFDPEFCKQIGGYPEGACLWYRHDGDHYDLVISKIGDNTYNFLENPEYIDGKIWDWAVPYATDSSGYPRIVQDPIRPFGTSSITIGSRSGSSIISDVYQVEKDGFAYSFADIEYEFDESEPLFSLRDRYFANGRMNGSTAFCGFQVYVGVSNAGPETNWNRGILPDVRGFLPHVSAIRGSMTDGQDVSGYPITSLRSPGFIYIGIEGSGIPFPSPISYKFYPLFTNSMGKRAVFFPVRKGQYIYLSMYSLARYKVNKLSVDFRIYNLSSFTEGMNA